MYCHARPTQSSLFPFDDYNMLHERDKFFTAYRETHEYGKDLRLLRENIAQKRAETATYLNELLLDQFRQLQKKYGRRISPVIRIRSGEPINSTPTIADIERLRPFHWCYDFDQVMNQLGGFDVIMTNPPWEVLRSETSSSNFYRSLFCQFAPQYAHQNPMEQNRIQRQSLNLYKPFVEQCYNLLCDGGYCGMVIPTGICTDQNAAGLRQLLFTQMRVMGVFCFENRWEILRGLDPRFEFTLLSFKKGQRTTTFPAAFSRQAVEDVEHFPEQNAVHISMNFLRRFSPGTLSLGKFRNQEDVSISEKMLRLPLLGEARHDAWNLKLGSGISSSPISRIELTEPGPDVLPLYEGKTIHQFTHMFAPLRHWVHRESLAQEEQRTFSNIARIVKQWQTSGDHGYHLVFRSVASSTNNRTMIATILPPEALANNTLNFVASRLDEDALLLHYRGLQRTLGRGYA